MADLLDEDVVPFVQGIRSLPGRPHVSWGYRALKGIRGVKLESILVGGRRFTSRQALHRFVQRVTAAAEKTVAPAVRAVSDRADEDHINSELDRAGF